MQKLIAVLFCNNINFILNNHLKGYTDKGNSGKFAQEVVRLTSPFMVYSNLVQEQITRYF